MSSKTLNKKKINVNRTVFIVIGVTIPIIHFLVFWVYVNFSSILLAFQTPRTYEWTLSNFVSLYDSVVNTGGQLRIGLRNSLLYFLQSFIIMVLNLTCAFFIYKKIRFYKFFRIIFYLPAIISGLVLTSVFTEFIKPNGPIGVLLSKIGINMPIEGLFYNASTATPTIMLYVFWTCFTGMLYYHGALARIPQEVIEAGRLDGVTPFVELTKIIFPLIWPMFSTLLIFNMTGLFTASGPILLFCPNGEGETMTVSFWMFKQVYGSGAYGGSGAYTLISAAGLILTALTVPLVFFTKWLAEKVPAVEY